MTTRLTSYDQSSKWQCISEDINHKMNRDYTCVAWTRSNEVEWQQAWPCLTKIQSKWEAYMVYNKGYKQHQLNHQAALCHLMQKSHDCKYAKNVRIQYLLIKITLKWWQNIFALKMYILKMYEICRSCISKPCKLHAIVVVEYVPGYMYVSLRYSHDMSLDKQTCSCTCM